MGDDLTRIERIKCPLCGYPVFGLPARHACPECGVAYDPYTKVVPLSPGLSWIEWGIVAVFILFPLLALTLDATGFVWVMHLTPDSTYPLIGLIIWVASACILLRLFARLLMLQTLVVNRQGVTWYRKRHQKKHISWNEFAKARYSWKTGRFEFLDVRDTSVHVLSYRDFGSGRCAARVERLINERIGVYRSESDRGFADPTRDPCSENREDVEH